MFFTAAFFYVGNEQGWERCAEQGSVLALKKNLANKHSTPANTMSLLSGNA